MRERRKQHARDAVSACGYRCSWRNSIRASHVASVKGRQTLSEVPSQGRTSAAQQVWSYLERASSSVLWVEGCRRDPQLLSHCAEPHRGTVWYRAPCTFFTPPHIFDGAWAAMTVATREHAFFATIKGRVTRLRRTARGHSNVSSEVVGWMDRAGATGDECVFRFTPHEAAVWAGGQDRLIFGVPMAAVQRRSKHLGLSRDHRR